MPARTASGAALHNKGMASRSIKRPAPTTGSCRNRTVPQTPRSAARMITPCRGSAESKAWILVCEAVEYALHERFGAGGLPPQPRQGLNI